MDEGGGGNKKKRNSLIESEHDRKRKENKESNTKQTCQVDENEELLDMSHVLAFIHKRAIPYHIIRFLFKMHIYKYI